jgi:hypothetical protein
VTGKQLIDALRRVARTAKEHAPAAAAETGFDGDVLDPVIEAFTQVLSAPPLAFEPVIAHRLAYSLVADAFLADHDSPS